MPEAIAGQSPCLGVGISGNARKQTCVTKTISRSRIRRGYKTRAAAPVAYICPPHRSAWIL